MLISTATCPNALFERGLEWWHGARISIGWKGLLYWPGETAGAASAERLEKKLEKAPIAEVAGALHGIFGLFLYERQTSSWSIMVDNAGLYRVFCDGEHVATSFLELLDHRRAKGNSIDAESLLDYIAHCAVFEERTAVQGVTKIQAGEILKLHPGGQPSLVRKLLPPRDTDDLEHIIDYYADLAAALSPFKLSVDMTGGFDSRVVACMLHHSGAVFDSHAASIVLLPRLAGLDAAEETRRQLTPIIARWITLIVLGIAIVLAVTMDWIVNLVFGPEYAPTADVLRWLLPGIVAYSCVMVLSPDLSARGRPDLNGWAAAVSLAVNVACNLLLIPLYGITGAALATTIAYAITAVITIWFYTRLSRNSAWAVMRLGRTDWEIIKVATATVRGKRP
jgi:Polysaccharide biosynthesis C-terminal domain